MNRSPQNHTDILQDRYGLKTASYLSAGTADLPYDISERLRAARAQAVAARKIAKVQTAPVSATASMGSTLTWGSDEGFSLWSRIGSILPLIALVVGLLAISSLQTDKLVQELAEVDSALLTDELPPDAFSDPGFVQFLKTTL
ncbi:DUF3619 family protein [Polaromonas eurypsychrophila]|uniref:DUF3619 family protein n=1 Tax=Polaromonas eurypsychrophila TaxID=1614635 RepID=A0A916WI19_9BURK|nr:DUF3619 family protein [Polaromonas eurypsychrophila]GGA99813.1 hypothetical protein GCM10011496_21070 [Polaromonas eurypsychrophila]